MPERDAQGERMAAMPVTAPLGLRGRVGQHLVYSGQSLLVIDSDGTVPGGGGMAGFYVENTRLLSRDVLTADGQPLDWFSASGVGGEGFLAYGTVPVKQREARNTTRVALRRHVDDGMRVALHIENYAPRDTACVTLSLHLAADFADMEQFDVGLQAEPGQEQDGSAFGPVHTAWDEAACELCFTLDHPTLRRAVAVRVVQSPVTPRYADYALHFDLILPPHDPAEIIWVVEPVFDGVRRPAPGVAPSPLRQLRERLRDDAPVLTTANTTVAAAWRSAIADLTALPLGLPDGPAAPAAGLPLYQQFFGRDTLTVGWQAAMVMPDLLRDALRVNAARQGTKTDDWRDEQPGRILHLARTGPRSLLGLDPFTAYYGNFSGPQDFLIMLGQYLAWTDDRDTVRGLLPAARRVLDWMDRDGDRDKDGLLEYDTRSPQGIKNQGWKDSTDAIIDADGEIVPNPIATCEMQGYWYAALQQAAYAFGVMGERRFARTLLRQAWQVRMRVEARFWDEALGGYVLGLGPDKQPIRSVSSNMGHMLITGVASAERGVRVARRLMEPDMFSGWGVRTLSAAHPAYDPFSYHRGSVWPVETAVFAYGLARYGCWEDLHHLTEGMFAVSDLFASNRLPEAIGGVPRDDAHPHPGVYPHSCEPQAWSAAAVIMLIQSLLGLLPVAPLGILFVDPHLPPWLPDVHLAGVRVGDATLDLAFERTKRGETRYRVTRQRGNVRVLRQPIPPAPGVSALARLRLLVSR